MMLACQDNIPSQTKHVPQYIEDCYATQYILDGFLCINLYSPQRQQTDRQTLTDTQSNKMTEQNKKEK